MPEEYYQALCDVAQHVDWRCRLALVLVHETGDSITSVRCLRWEDADFEEEVIVWPGEFDKQRKEHVAPLSREARTALVDVQTRRSAYGRGWLIPAVKDESKPCPRRTLDRMFDRAEEFPAIPVQPGLRWHSMRRKLPRDGKGGSLKTNRHLWPNCRNGERRLS